MVKAYRNIRIKKENKMAGEREAEGKKWNAPKLLPVHKLWRITIFYIIYLRFIACFTRGYFPVFSSTHLRALTNASIHGVTSSLWMRFSG